MWAKCTAQNLMVGVQQDVGLPKGVLEFTHYTFYFKLLFGKGSTINELAKQKNIDLLFSLLSPFLLSSALYTCSFSSLSFLCMCMCLCYFFSTSPPIP